MKENNTHRDFHKLTRVEAALNSVNAPVVIFEAPSGFGKTIQGRRWMDALALQNNKSVTWFKQSQHADLTQILENANTLTERHWIFIDDSHLVDKELLLSLVNFAIHLAPNLNLVLMQRYNASIRFAAHRLKGDVACIPKEILAFTHDEIRHYLKCSKAESIEIFKKFQGWPAAIKCIKNQSKDKTAENSATKMSASNIFWNLVEEDVITGLPQSSLNGFISLSVLNPLNLDDAQNIIAISPEELAVTVRRLESVWVSAEACMHPCVREGLQRLGWARDPEKMKQLHLKACQFYWNKGEIITALDHASKSGQTNYVCELIEDAGGLLLFLNEGLERVQQVMSFANSELCEAYPRLMLIKALLHIKQGQLDQAHKCWSTAQEVSQGFTQDRVGGDVKALRDESEVMGTYLAGYGCHSLEEQIALAQTHHAQTSDAFLRNETLNGHLHTVNCLHALQNGRFQDVRKHAALSETALEKSGSDYGILFLDFHRGGAAYGEARLQAAQESYASAESRRRRFFHEDEGLRFIGKVFTAELDCETGSFLSVKRKLSRVSKRLKVSEAWFDVYAAAIRSQSYLTYLGEGYERAVEFLRDIARDANIKGLKRVQHYADTLRLELACRSHDKEEADRLAKKLNIKEALAGSEKLNYLMWREYVAVIIAHSLYLDSQGKGHEAKPFLEDFIQYGQTSGNRICELYGLSLYVTLYSGRVQELGTILKQTGFILPLIISKRLQSIFSRDKRYAGLAGQAVDCLSKLHPSKSGEFTAREREIIRYLADELADKEIALHLDVSVHTVRFHMKNIFKKTGEHDRSNAAIKAEYMISSISR